MLALALSFLATLVGAPTPASARTIDWSGRTWDVRPTGFGGPGPNQWSDSTANVSVDNGELVLSVVQDASGRWTCPEISLPQHLGYGTYRWVVDSDLRGIDANDVLGMFTYGGGAPSNNEIDIEAAHWGNLAWPSGSATVWQDAGAGLRESSPFNYAGPPPYLNQFTWSQGSIHYLVLDGTGATVFEWTETSGVPVPSTETPYTNYWRSSGVAPAGPKSMRIASFTWFPPGDPNADPPRSGVVAGDPPAQAQPPAAPAAPETAPVAPPAAPTAVTTVPARLRLSVQPRRFALRGRRADGRIVWSASQSVLMRIDVQRRSRRGSFRSVGALTRAIPAGRGAMRFPRRVNGRRLRTGVYRLQLSSAGDAVSFRVPRSVFRILPG